MHIPARAVGIGVITAVLAAASEPLIRVTTNRVLVPVTVTDRNGKPFLDLKANDLRVFEGKEQRPILWFWREDAPVSVAIVVDLSRSMRNKLKETVAAVGEVTKALDEDDIAALITFSDHPRVVAGFSPEPELLKQHLSRANADGNTALIDAVYLGVRKVKAAGRPRKALVVISDGADTCSQYTQKELASLVMESDVQIYTIAILEAVESRDEQRGRWFLADLSENSGGLHFTVRYREALPEAARKLAAAMKNLYVIGYAPGPALPGTWRKIRIAMDRPQQRPVRITARPGYFQP